MRRDLILAAGIVTSSATCAMLAAALVGPGPPGNEHRAYLFVGELVFVVSIFCAAGDVALLSALARKRKWFAKWPAPFVVGAITAVLPALLLCVLHGARPRDALEVTGVAFAFGGLGGFVFTPFWLRSERLRESGEGR